MGGAGGGTGTEAGGIRTWEARAEKRSACKVSSARDAEGVAFTKRQARPPPLPPVAPKKFWKRRVSFDSR